jgi:hypothetical protein
MTNGWMTSVSDVLAIGINGPGLKPTLSLGDFVGGAEAPPFHLKDKSKYRDSGFARMTSVAVGVGVAD